MKRIHLELPVVTEVISLSNLLNTNVTDRFYGVDYRGNRGFIAREFYEKGRYRTLCCLQLTMGNRWDAFSGDTLAETIGNILNRDSVATPAAVYVFDTYEELMAWLSRK